MSAFPPLLPVRGAPRALVVADQLDRAPTLASITGASDFRRRAADALALRAVRRSTALLGPHHRLPWPADPDALFESWRTALPGFRLYGAVTPRQHGRRRLSVIGDYAGAAVIIKVGMPNDGLEREAAVLATLHRRPLPTIRTPRLLGMGGCHGDLVDHAVDAVRGHTIGIASTEPDVAWIATEAIAVGSQRPALNYSLRAFEGELTDRLHDLGLPHFSGSDSDSDSDSDSELASTSVIVHGDFTPWNLRRTPYGLALFDWESCGWGASGTDARSYATATAALPAAQRLLLRIGGAS